MIDGMISQAGICTKHNIEKMFVGLDTNIEPTCVKCTADATPKLGRSQTVADPGEHFFNRSVKPTERPDVATPAVELGSMKDIIGTAVSRLKRLPMPDDIKQFKAVQKAIKTLESLVEKSNG